MLGKVETTQRGFEKVEFTDSYGLQASIQQSSAIGTCPTPGGSFVWLGLSNDRMHLNREQVYDLIQLLTQWHETGSLLKEMTDATNATLAPRES